jgi:hypothetical protein
MSTANKTAADKAWAYARDTLAGDGITARSAGRLNPVIHIVTRAGVNPMTWCHGVLAVAVATSSSKRCPQCQRLARMAFDAAQAAGHADR